MHTFEKNLKGQCHEMVIWDKALEYKNRLNYGSRTYFYN
jgi:hypothetical protein